VIWLLDTNTIIYAQYLGGTVRERLDDASKRGRIVTSILVIAELLYGAERSSRPEANRKKVDAGATLVTKDGALLAGDIEGLVSENWI
jgi:predicted nucleic acid-binding protein